MRRLLLLRHATRPFASLRELAGVVDERAGEALAEAEARLDAEAEVLVTTLHDAAGPAAGAEGARRNALLALKRDAHNRRSLRPDDLVASGLADRCASYLSRFEELALAESRWGRAFDDGAEHARRALTHAVRDPLVLAGLASASGPLASKLLRLSAETPERWSHGERHVGAKAAAYLARFATKTSPNSVFCAVGLAWVEDGPAHLRGTPTIARMDVSLSVAESRKIAVVMAGDPDLAPIVRPRPNPTLREDGGALTFWRFASLRRADDDETLSRVKEHPVLRAVLEAASSRPTIPELVRAVARASSIDEPSIGRFIAQMIERGVLIGEFEIPFTERRPLRLVAAAARGVRPEPAWAASALAIEDEVDRLAALPLEADERASTMSGIAYALESLPHVRPLRRDELFRIDAASALSLHLPSSVMDELDRGLRPYLRLFAALYPARRYLQGWVDRFLAKFPAGRDVPMLDVYHAITEQDESYRPAAFPEPSRDDPEASAHRALGAVRDLIAERGRLGGPVTLDDADLDRLVGPGRPSFRWAAGVLFQIDAADRASLDAGDYRIVLNGLFHGAGLSLSRFAHLLGDDVVAELRRAWSVVTRPGAIVAELTYNHGGRTANAGLRPAIFGHEIELPGDCASPGTLPLALRDLAVRWDADADRFVLFRTADGVEIIPVINSGVNPVGFVSFLVAIGEQGLQPVAYFPGFEIEGVTRWPRVLCGRVVLFRERWSFGPADRPAGATRGDDLRPFARAVASWRRRHGIPRHVFAFTTKEPKPRYVDLASPTFLDLLRRDLQALGTEPDGRLHVSEMLPGPGGLWAGGHASEFLCQMSGGSDR